MCSILSEEREWFNPATNNVFSHSLPHSVSHSLSLSLNKGEESDGNEGEGDQDNVEPSWPPVKIAQMLHCLNVIQSGIDANVSVDVKPKQIELKVRELYKMLKDISLSNKNQSLITKFFH